MKTISARKWRKLVLFPFLLLLLLLSFDTVLYLQEMQNAVLLLTLTGLCGQKCVGVYIILNCISNQKLSW